MFKSNVALALSLSLLLGTSILSTASAGKNDRNEVVDPDNRVEKKVKISQPSKKRLLLQDKRKKIKTHNTELVASLPEAPKIWGKVHRDLWAGVGNLLSLRDFIVLFSTNTQFLALGEELIKKRPHSISESNCFLGAVIAVPFKLEGPFNNRRFTLSHLMREDLLHDCFSGVRDCHEMDKTLFDQTESNFYTHRAQYYASIHPLMASFWTVQRHQVSPFFNQEELLKAGGKVAGKFNEDLREYTRRLDPLALEMILYSKLIDKYTSKDDFLARAFPNESFPVKHRMGKVDMDLWAEVVKQLIRRTPNPDYLVNLAHLVTSNASRHDDCENIATTVWERVAKPVLALKEPGRRLIPFNGSHKVEILLKDEDEARNYFNTDKTFKTKLAVLRYLASNAFSFCPTMVVLHHLVDMFEMKSQERVFGFHPEHVKEVESYLLRLLSFSNRSDEFTKYNENNFEHFYGDAAEIAAAMAQDHSLQNIDDYKIFALRNLLKLYHQVNDDKKMQGIIEQMKKDGRGASLHCIAACFEEMGSVNRAIPYYESALLKGHLEAVQGLWRIKARQFGIDENTINMPLQQNPRMLFVHIAKLYLDTSDYNEALRYLSLGIPLDSSGFMEYCAARVCCRHLKDQERFDSFIKAAVAKNYKGAIDLINRANEAGLSSFELMQKENQSRAEQK